MPFTALSQLVHSPSDFLAAPPVRPEVWRAPDHCSVLSFSLTDLDRIVAAWPAGGRLRLFADGTQVPTSQYTWGASAPHPSLRGQLRSRSIGKLVGRGATLVINDLELMSEPLGDLCRQLTAETGQGVTMGAFVTPADATGLSPHYDPESVLLVQTYGSKVWRLHESSEPSPLEHERYVRLSPEDEERVSTRSPDMEVTLQAGDVLWIPRGWLHGSATTGEPSLHVTVGFTPYTRYWLANQIVKALDERLEGHDWYRTELPWGLAARKELLEREVAATIARLSQTLSTLEPRVAAEWATRAQRNRRLAPASPHPISTAISPVTSQDTPVVIVPEAISSVKPLSDGRLRLDLRDTTLTIPAAAAAVVQEGLMSDEAPTLCARDLIPAMSVEASMRLVATLLLEGVAKVRQH
ncbi:JmjC domain-containing protein [Streptomyces sp. NPDC086010]|uniref:JmjC domain-containing protein n=1 Tax=Streptomyces sp. NPDC086010 TaxID=3365745 RepID=UPI0037D3A327